MSDRGNGEPIDLAFAARLNRLFETVYPPGRGPYRDTEVVAALRERGCPVSRPYLSQLRSGQRTRPSTSTLASLAEFFRIRTDYFTDDVYYATLNEELTLLARPRHDTVARIAAGLVGLSPEARRDVMKTINELHRRRHPNNQRLSTMAAIRTLDRAWAAKG